MGAGYRILYSFCSFAQYALIKGILFYQQLITTTMSKSFRFVLFCAGIMMFASCKNFQVKDEYFVVNPNPLEVQGGQVNYTVTGTFPSKTFIKKVVCTATPELRWEGGSVKGEPVLLQGEKIQGNGQTIEWKEGGSFTYNGNFSFE